MTSFESSGNSHVELLSVEQQVCARQVFKQPLEYQRVKQMALLIHGAGPINVLFERGIRYTYKLQPFHSVLLQNADSKQQIDWKVIQCLNQNERYLWIVQDNIEKFLWDILRGIVGLHVLGYLHNDVSLDNIGIRDGCFVLFDYNMSKRLEYAHTDFYKLIRSLRFHFDNKLPFDWSEEYLYTLEDFVYVIQEQRKFKTVTETIRYLDSLRIHYS
jgi:hypothetical protein